MTPRIVWGEGLLSFVVLIVLKERNTDTSKHLFLGRVEGKPKEHLPLERDTPRWTCSRFWCKNWCQHGINLIGDWQTPEAAGFACEFEFWVLLLWGWGYPVLFKGAKRSRRPSVCLALPGDSDMLKITPKMGGMCVRLKLDRKGRLPLCFLFN